MDEDGVLVNVYVFSLFNFFIQKYVIAYVLSNLRFPLVGFP